MRPLCVMKPVWSNIDGGSDAEVPSFSSAAILKRRRRQQSTMTIRLRRQSRTEPRPEQNTVKIMTHGRVRLKDYWYVLCVVCVSVCVMCVCVCVCGVCVSMCGVCVCVCDVCRVCVFVCVWCVYVCVCVSVCV